MVTLIFISETRFGQVQVKKGQISKLKKKSFQNIPILSTFASEFQKCHLFYVLQLKMPKIGDKKVGSSRFPGFGAIAQPAMKILSCNRVHWLLVYSSILCIPFLYL